MKESIYYEHQQNFYIETIESGSSIRVVTQRLIPKRLTTLPYINPKNVIGRDKDLEVVQQLLAQSQKVVLVNGLGGIGKTTLAKVLLEQDRQQYQHIAWVNVVEDLKEAFVFNPVLMDNLVIDLEQIPKNEDFIPYAFEITINRLRQLKGHNLLIIDNAQQDIGIARNIDLIALEDNWQVLVTSRQYLEGFELYELGFLSPVAARQLFYFHYTIEQEDDIVQQILEAIDYHTLAIEVIAKTGQSKQLTLAEIKQALAAKGLSFTTNTALKLSYTHKKRIENIYAFILAAFEVADLSKDEQWILMQFSVLPALYIPFQNNEGENILEFLQITDSHERDRFSDTINAIRAKGWLNLESQMDAFKMHQLLQELLRDKLQPNVETCQILIEQLTAKIYAKQAENPTKSLRFLSYSEHLTKYIKGKSLELFYLLYDIGEVHRMIVGFKSALTYHQKGLAMFTSVEGDDLNMKGSIHSAMGLCLLGLKDFESALQHQLEELAIFEQKDEQRDIAIAHDNIGLTYQAMGQYETSLQHHLKAFAVFKDILEETDFSLGQSYHNVSLAYSYVLKFPEALEYSLKAIELREKYLDDLHPLTAQSYHNICYIYYELDELDKAWAAIEKAYSIRKQILSEDHPYFLSTKTRREQLLDFMNRQQTKTNDT